jgi:rhodanese-related sulfurtransferase
MSAEQVLLYGVVGLIGLFMARRFFLVRSVPHYSAGEVAEMIRKREAIVLLDVRTAREHEQRAIRGSLHIPAHELRGRAGEMEKHRSSEIICYCASGSRSLSAAGMLRKLGYKAANMRGGMAEWNSQDHRS